MQLCLELQIAQQFYVNYPVPKVPFNPEKKLNIGL